MQINRNTPAARDRESTQSRADDLAAARAADTESSADRAAREAVVRRLDNERQYLKSQLQSEITCKDELREALATATRQLGDIKVWVGGGSVESASRQENRGGGGCRICVTTRPDGLRVLRAGDGIFWARKRQRETAMSM